MRLFRRKIWGILSFFLFSLFPFFLTEEKRDGGKENNKVRKVMSRNPNTTVFAFNKATIFSLKILVYISNGKNTFKPARLLTCVSGTLYVCKEAKITLKCVLHCGKEV